MSSLTAALTGNGSTGYDEVALLRSEVEARFGRLGRAKRSMQPSGDPFAFEPLVDDPTQDSANDTAAPPQVALSERLDALLG